MPLQVAKALLKSEKKVEKQACFKEHIFSKDYVDFLNEAGWILERKLPSKINCYSDLLEDTDWESNNLNSTKSSRHYRRDLDSLS